MGPAFRVLQTRVDLDPQLPGAVIVKVHIANRTAIRAPLSGHSADPYRS